MTTLDILNEWASSTDMNADDQKALSHAQGILNQINILQLQTVLDHIHFKSPDIWQQSVDGKITDIIVCVKGRYVADDKSTPNVNEAYVDGKTPKKKAPAKK